MAVFSFKSRAALPKTEVLEKPQVTLQKTAQFSSRFAFPQFRLFPEAAFRRLGAAFRKGAALYFFQDSPHFSL
jgi:hypothetical protein